MIKKIIQEISGALKEVGFEKNITIVPTLHKELGDFSLICFELAKVLKIKPDKLAKDIESRMEKHTFPLVEKVVAFGPYVNFYLNISELAKLFFEELEIQKEQYGNENLGNAKKIMIEYPSQNTHKEFHIGHLRNVCIGNTLVELYKKCGYEVTAVNYINDFGSHVVKCLWGIQKFHKEEAPKENKQKWLGEVYTEASKYIKDHPEVQSELDELQKKLEAHDSEIWPLFEKTRQWSIEGFERLNKELVIEYDYTFYESEVKDRGQELVNELIKKGVAVEGEKGAIIVDLQKYDLDIALLRKSTGAGLYMTADLALAEKKFKSANIEESINITGIEQNFYFKQLFKVLELSGFKNKMTHIGYGLVNLPEGKMASRSGNVILYEDLRDEIFKNLFEECKIRHSDWSEEKLEKTAHTLTMAVLKFTMQKHEAQKNVIFNMKEAVSFEGFSAPYILYVIARINSLIKKSKIKDHPDLVGTKINYENLKEPEEKKILLLLAEYPEIIKKALENYNPSVIAKYCFDVAQAFNEFYNKHQILAVDKDSMWSRLKLGEMVKRVLDNALHVLSIEVLEEM